MGHFVAGEEMGHFVTGTICRMGRKWNILSSGTICHPKNAGGTICRWDKMSPNLKMDVLDHGDGDDDLEKFSSPSRWMSGEAPFSFA